MNKEELIKSALDEFERLICELSDVFLFEAYHLYSINCGYILKTI